MHFILLGHPDSTASHVLYSPQEVIKEGLTAKKIFPHTRKTCKNIQTYKQCLQTLFLVVIADILDEKKTLSYCTYCLKMDTSSLQYGIIENNKRHLKDLKKNIKSINILYSCNFKYN